MASTPIPHILFVLLPHRLGCCLPFIAAAGKVTFLIQLNLGQLIYMPDMLVAIVALKQVRCAQQRGIRVYCEHMGGQSKEGMARPFSYPRYGHRCRPRYHGTEPFWNSLLNRSCHLFSMTMRSGATFSAPPRFVEIRYHRATRNTTHLQT